MENLTMDSVIDEKVIENCELNGACDEGLNWLCLKARTFASLRKYKNSWFQWLAEHITLAFVLELLSKDADTYVRWGVARNPHTPVAVLELLSKDADTDVRWGVAQNPHTPVAVATVPEELQAALQGD